MQMNYTLANEKDFTMVGIYINGEYIRNSYNAENGFVIDLSKYSTDIVVEVKFVKNNVEKFGGMDFFTTFAIQSI